MADLKSEFCQLYFANLNYLLMHRTNLILQKIFLDRWHETTNKKWSNSEEQGKAFVSEIGKGIWTTSSRRQKLLLLSGNVYLWDLKLCSHVLQKFHNDKEEEKNKLKELVVIQNEIKRNFDELFIPEDLYKNSWETVKKILDDFGHTMIPYAIDMPNLAWSSENLLVLKNSLKSPNQFFMTDTFPEDINPLHTLKAKDLKELGNTFYKDNKYDEALQAYKQALDLKGVSKKLQGVLYSNASAVSSAQIKNPKEESALEQLSGFVVTIDLEYAKRAVQLCPLWYRAHCRLGYAYEKCKKWKKAVRHFDIAILLNGGMPDVIKIRNECSKKIHQRISSKELYIEQLKIDVESTIQNIVGKFGKNAAEKVYNSNIPEMVIARTKKKITEAKTAQDYDEILKTLKKEGAKGSTLALHTLGMMHKNGAGVKRDFLQSITYFKQAANKNSKLTLGLPDESVFGAENQLGIIYQYGLGVCNDLEEAAIWYKRSSDHHGLHGPCNLGMMYLRGSGVARNLVKAEQYLTLAAKRRNADAMNELAQFYLTVAEDPAKALQWHHRAIECGNYFAVENSKEIEFKIESLKLKYKFIDNKLENWELKKGLAVDGMMMTERRNRYLERQNPEFVEYASSMKEVNENFKKTQLLHDYTPRPFSDAIIEEYVKKGSMTAEKIKKATAHFKKASEHLKIRNVHEAIKELANGLRITEFVANYKICSLTIEMVSVTGLINAIKPNTQIDKDFRVCMVFSLGNDYQSSISLLEESMKMYEDENLFPIMLTNIYGFMQNHKKGIEVANEALKKFPDDAGVWYAKAVHLTNLSLNNIEIIDAYKKFISLVHPDHREVPISYYTIAAYYLNHNPEDLTTVAKYYKQGLDAEKLQLPFFLPVECYHKSVLEKLSSLKSFLRLQFAHDEPIPRKCKIEKKENEEKRKLKKLLDPQRVWLIVLHRKYVAKMIKLKSKSQSLPITGGTLIPKLQQTGPPQLAEVKSIVLEEMDPTKNRIYEGFALSCVVIDEPVLGFPSVHLNIEDENWDVSRLCVYNIPQDEEIHSKLGFGCRLIILNPYYKKGELGNLLFIRVDDPESIVFEGRDVNRCRFCGKNNAALQCSKCHKAAYCNRECQTNDWKVMKHKYICH